MSDIFQTNSSNRSTFGSAKKTNRKLVSSLATVTVLLVAALGYILISSQLTTNLFPTQQSSSSAKPSISQATATATPGTQPTIKAVLPASCGDLLQFADKPMGMVFCYPKTWGTARVVEAKVSPSDTGYRQIISFSSNPLVSVGGVSQDWSTTVGRGVGCLEPNNKVPDLSSYNTDWHDLSGSGGSTTYAIRSLPANNGGFDLTETISDQYALCVQGHKVINGSRYKVASVNFSRDFSASAGITSPRTHIDNPNVLFSQAQRDELAAVLVTLVAY